MSDISEMIKEGYNHAVMLNVQQRGSKLIGCVRQEIQNNERYFYDQIKPTEAQDVTTRHSDTPIMATNFDRRAITLIRSDWGDLIDRVDQLKILGDPTSAYALNAGYALGRRQDLRIIEASLGNAYCGSKGEKIVALPKEQKIEANFADAKATEGTGLTIDKLREARQRLDEANIDDDEEQYCIITAKQVSDLLRTTEVTSEDYNTVKALVDGKINTFMGFSFKRVDSKLLPKSNGERSVICFAKSGLLFASDGEIKTEISVRSDKRMAIQVYVAMSCGATRMDEKKVIEILCKE